MVNCTMELTKEQYDELMTASKGRGVVPEELETKYFDISTLRGYGLYGTRVYEKDGKYFLNYNRGESCD